MAELHNAEGAAPASADERDEEFAEVVAKIKARRAPGPVGAPATPLEAPSRDRAGIAPGNPAISRKRA